VLVIYRLFFSKNLNTLELLSYPISLGTDTFTTGKVSFEAVDKTLFFPGCH
jgi:hypothetical protein